jgi:predicted nucleic acid-binding protein
LWSSVGSVIDTDVPAQSIALLTGEKKVIDQVAKSGEIFLSIIVLGELYFWAQKSRQVQENMGRINSGFIRNQLRV